MRCVMVNRPRKSKLRLHGVVTSVDETATVGYEYIAHSIDNRVVLTNLTAQLEYAITNMAYIVSIHKTIEEIDSLHFVYII